MDILEQAQKLQDDANQVAQEAAGMKDAVKAFGDAQYTKGWDEAMLQAGSAGTSDKIYSEAELNAEIARVTGVLQPQIDAANAQAAALQGEVDSIPAKLDAASAGAREALKNEILADMDAQASQEAQEESDLRSKIAGK